MRVLVACEFSGTVRDAFSNAGHDAWSCDVELSETEGNHHHGDIVWLLNNSEWDLIIMHPPCTHIAVSGNRWYAGTIERQESIEWTMRLYGRAKAVAPSVCMENPVGVLPIKASQYIQPWQFGHPESKKTGLWLHNLPKLKPTHEKPDMIEERIWKMPPSPDRAKERSRFYPGIAQAMVKQWASR